MKRQCYPIYFFTILLSTHLVNSKPVIRSLGYPWHVFLCFEEIWESCFWDILLQISMIFHDQTKSVMNLKNFFYYIDMIMYHCNFFEVDPRTLESPHGTFINVLKQLFDVFDSSILSPSLRYHRKMHWNLLQLEWGEVNLCMYVYWKYLLCYKIWNTAFLLYWVEYYKMLCFFCKKIIIKWNKCRWFIVRYASLTL